VARAHDDNNSPSDRSKQQRTCWPETRAPPKAGLLSQSANSFDWRLFARVLLSFSMSFSVSKCIMTQYGKEPLAPLNGSKKINV
jgi:hypothetical protein